MMPPVTTVKSLYLVPVMLLLLLSGCEFGDANIADTRYFHQVKPQLLEQQASYTVQRRLVGRVEARQRVDMGFELAGTVEQVLVNDGDTVQVGQLMATMDTRLLDVQRQQLQAQQEEIQARRHLADLALARQASLRTKGFAAEQRMDELRAELDVLAAQRSRQEALLEEVETRIGKSSLLAPYSGQVSTRHLDAGAVTRAGQAVIQILEQGNTEARIGVPAKLASALKVGDEATLIIANNAVASTVIAVGHSMDPVTHTVSVRLSIACESCAVDGQVVYLEQAEIRQQTGFWVPVSALSAGIRGMWNLLVLMPDTESGQSRLEARSINLLHMSADRAYVKGAVRDGETIVATGVHRLAVGQLVRVGEG